MQGNVLSSDTRYEAIRIGVLNHLYHHRAQVTTYLRLKPEAGAGALGALGR